MKFFHRFSECEVLPNGISYSWGSGRSSYRDPFGISGVVDHWINVYLRFGIIRFRWDVAWETKAPRCPRCKKIVASPGRCMVCTATMPLEEAYKDAPFYDPARLPRKS